MLSGLEAALALAAILAGLAGTWSPCGFSMIETIGPRGHRGGAPTTIAACATFFCGALAGGVLTFGSLALVGELAHGAGGRFAYMAAVVIALAAAIAELRGVAIVPQIRRQVPETWRRRMAMPIAAGLYGVLLGLGFTTFILTFGVFALAGICFAVGEPQAGLAVGLAFGLGRALPVVAIAPLAEREAGARALELMAGEPRVLGGFRFAGGLALALAAAALAVAVPAGAARTEARPAADPAATGGDLVFSRPGGEGRLRRPGPDAPLPGHDPAAGDGRIAVVRSDEIVILSARDLSETGRVPAAGADAVAVSAKWVVWRARQAGKDYLRARNISDPAAPGPEQSLGRAGGAAQLGRPSLDSNRLVYARATRAENTIVKRVLGSQRKKRAKTTVMRSGVVGLSNPSIRGSALLYVRHTPGADRLKLASLRGRGDGRTLLSRRTGTLWSTALTEDRAYVTLISGTAPRQRILSVGR